MDEKYLEALKICRNKSLEEVKLFFEKNLKYINGENEFYYGITPLFVALEKKRDDIVSYLLDIGADPNKNIGQIENKIYGDDDINIPEPTINCLISSETDTSGDETRKKYNERLNNTKAMEILIKKGADVNKPNSAGYTPLDKCVYYKHKPAEKLLKKYGAKHSKRFVDNEIEESKEINKKKIEYLNIPYINKNPPAFHNIIQKTFYYYKFMGSPLLLGDLKEKKYDKNQKDWKGRTPLDFALEIGHHVAVDYFRSIGAKTSKELEEESKE